MSSWKPEPFSSSRQSLDHAKHRLAEFEREHQAFFDGNPYAQVTEVNADGTEDFIKVKLVKPMPLRLGGIAFEVLTNLRSSLDQAGYDVAVAAKTNPKHAHFPFGNDITNAEGQASGRSKSLPKDIFDLMISFKPYHGGNHLLWGLNELCNTHKHEIFTPVALYTGGGNTGLTSFQSGLLSYAFPPKWDSTKQEMILAHVKHGATYNINCKIQTFIAINKVDGIIGQPAIRILHDMTGIVEPIIEAIEAKARTIGLLT